MVQTITVALANSTATATFPAWSCTDSAEQCVNTKTGCGVKYYRTVSYLSVANLQVQLPDSCSSGPCSPSQLIASGCSLTYVQAARIASA